VRLLRAAGAELNNRASNGETALHSAAAHGWDETVKVLATEGAELEALDAKGLTPIDHAVGRQERGFLATEAKPRATTIALLTEYIVAKTGRQPKEFSGTFADQTKGTAGAGNGL
jgi:hypothetical protein